MDILLFSIMILIAVICAVAAIVSVFSMVMYFIEEYNIREKIK